MENSLSDRLRYGRVLSIIALALVVFATFSQHASAFKTGENASLVIGQSNFNSNTCSGGSFGGSTQSGLCDPEGSTFDASGNLWVSDHLNSRVLEFTSPFSNGESASLVIGQPSFTTNECSSINAQSALCGPGGLVFDSSGNLWVADSGHNRILEFVSPFSDGESASLVIGQPNFTGNLCSTITTQSGLCSPGGLAFDTSGNLWVADRVNTRVLEFMFPFSNGESASLVLGQSGFNTATCIGGVPGVFNFVGLPTTQSGLCDPYGLAFDSSGNLWVVDAGNSRVLEFNHPFSNGENASQVIGQSDFTTSTPACSPTRSGLCFPFASAFDSKGNLWVTDFTVNRVLEFKRPFSNGENASRVIGQSNFTTAGCSPTQSGLCFPFGLAFDPSGNLWVTDSRNNRVLAFADEGHHL